MSRCPMSRADCAFRLLDRLMQAVRLAAVLAIVLGWGHSALAGGPRFVSGFGLAVQPGQAEGWATTQLQYFTDPGDLGTGVAHAQADAMVTAAAAVWNVPSSSISLVQGGQLGEHVSGANSYFDGSGFVFPADVQASNESNVPVAILYDTDGSITDLLLGAGASEPAGCRQNGVLQSVDDIQTDGHIHHALLVLNGRCVGEAPEQLLQMQYQLARAFGRVLGLAWSQNNDNVFTAASPVTADQIAYWPLMHPLDVLCGPYSYQCMPNPFDLRQDDLSALAVLYPVLASNVPQGKQASDAGGNFLFMICSFPTGQGMDWVNVAATRTHYGARDPYQLVSGLAGTYYQQSLGSPVTGAQATNQGTNQGFQEGIAGLRAVPVEGVSDVTLTSEPINPLYAGEYAIGPYVRPPVTPSGSSQSVTFYSAQPYPDVPLGIGAVAPDAAANCSPGNDGTEAAPAPLDPSGWQSGQLCGWGHNSWWNVAMKAGRSWTLEVTATDESGAASISKAQTVVGIWDATDAIGTLPTIASQSVPFNSLAFGVTQIKMPVAAADRSVRFVVGDAYGAGRPDFTYTTRVFYADSVTPAAVGSGGGSITIQGTGFRRGNAVTVNGVVATVTSWSANTIVAIAPSAASSRAATGTPVTVAVSDGMTGATTAITRALTYTRAPNVLKVVSAPAALETGVTASVPFAVRLLASDQATPVAGVALDLAVTAGSAALSACAPGQTCQMVTDNNGFAQAWVTAGAVGSVTLTAAEPRTGAEISVQVAAVAPSRTVVIASQAAYLAAGASAAWTIQLQTLQDGLALPAVQTMWSAGTGLDLVSSTAASNSLGVSTAIISVADVLPGSTQTLSGCAWTSSCATWSVYGVDPSQWQLAVGAGAGQAVSQLSTLGALTMSVTDAAGHVIQGAPVTVHQRVLGWEGQCSTSSRCPSAPVLAAADTVLTSDANGSLTLQPLQMAGVPQTVEIAVSTGTQGFVAITLVKTPAVP